MNRKARRAARSPKGAQQYATALPGAARPESRRLFDAARHHHHDGRLGEAAKLYHQVLTLEPKHIDSLHNLGVIALQAGQNEMAVSLISQAIALNDLVPDYHRSIAIALLALGKTDDAIVYSRQAIKLKPSDAEANAVLARALERQGKHDEARTVYERVLTLDPDNAPALVALGNFLMAQGRLDRAIAAFERALSNDPDNVHAHYSLGVLYREQGRLEQSVDCFLRTIELKPDLIEAHHSFCSTLIMQSKSEAVMAYYEQVLAIKPDFADGYFLLAVGYLRAGHAKRALDAVRRGLKVGETAYGKSVFVKCARELAKLPEDMRDIVARAISEPWARPGDLVGHAMLLIRSNPEIAHCIERATQAWPAVLSAQDLYGESGLQALSRDLLLRTVLENTRVGDVALEKCLAAARAALLEEATNAPDDATLDGNVLAFYCALARQCFITEYAYWQDDRESAQVDALRASLEAALQAGGNIPTLQLIALSCYLPLHMLPRHENLLARSWPDCVNELLTQQIREPAEEQRLRGTIPRLTPIEDLISTQVQQQYEENPYPRWIKLAPSSRPRSILMFLRNTYPFATLRALETGANVDMLIAGCGTGQQVVDSCRTFANSRVLAIDISLSSLSYAKRKSQELGMHDIEYGPGGYSETCITGPHLRYH